MAGMPVRRARKALADHQRMLRQRGGDEPDFPQYFSSTAAEPVRHVAPSAYNGPPPPVVEMPPAPPARPSAPAVSPRAAPSSAPPLTAAQAAIFDELRSRALQGLLDFIKEPLDPYKPGYDRLKLKQLEAMQQILTLGGRIDPGKMRGQQDDEMGEWLEQIKGKA